MSDASVTFEAENVSPEALAHLGEGHIAYVKQVRSEDVPGLFPQAPKIAPGLKLFALHAADGTPIMAWHDLIAHLGTLTINEVALPFGERRTIHMLARPAALQQQAFALLGVPLPRVQ